MSKRAWIVLVCILVISLSACHSAGPGETFSTTPPVTSPPPETTAPPVTTTPLETTAPTQPLYPAAPVIQASCELVTDIAPEYDFRAETNIVLESETANPWFKTSYIRLFTDHAAGRWPLDDNVFWICEDLWEGNSDSHYKNYVVKNGHLEALPQYSLTRTYTLYGVSVILNVEYSLYGDQVLINYTPIRRTNSYGSIVDTGRGVHECLARFYVELADGTYTTYYAKIDLETGVLTELHPGLDPAVLAGTDFVYWCDNGNLILDKFTTSSDSVLCCYNVTNQMLTEYGLERKQVKVEWRSSEITPKGLLYQIRYQNKDTDLVLINRTDGSLSPRRDEPSFETTITTNSRHFRVYQDNNKIRYVYSLATGECASFPNATTFGAMDHFVFYKDASGTEFIYDVAENEAAAIPFPEDFLQNRNRVLIQESYDGNMIAWYYIDKNKTCQILVFDAATNTFIRLQRTGLQGLTENNVQWSSDSNKLIVTMTYPTLSKSNTQRNFCIYDFTK